MEKQYNDLIISLIKQHAKYPGHEAFLSEIAEDVYQHSKVVISSVSNEDVIISYLNKVVSNSIVTIGKRHNVNVRQRHTVKSVLSSIESSRAETAKIIEQQAKDAQKSAIRHAEIHPQIVECRNACAKDLDIKQQQTENVSENIIKNSTILVEEKQTIEPVVEEPKENILEFHAETPVETPVEPEITNELEEDEETFIEKVYIDTLPETDEPKSDTEEPIEDNSIETELSISDNSVEDSSIETELSISDNSIEDSSIETELSISDNSVEDSSIETELSISDNSIEDSSIETELSISDDSVEDSSIEPELSISDNSVEDSSIETELSISDNSVEDSSIETELSISDDSVKELDIEESVPETSQLETGSETKPDMDLVEKMINGVKKEEEVQAPEIESLEFTEDVSFDDFENLETFEVENIAEELPIQTEIDEEIVENIESVNTEETIEPIEIIDTEETVLEDESETESLVEFAQNIANELVENSLIDEPQTEPELVIETEPELVEEAEPESSEELILESSEEKVEEIVIEEDTIEQESETDEMLIEEDSEDSLMDFSIGDSSDNSLLEFDNETDNLTFVNSDEVIEETTNSAPVETNSMYDKFAFEPTDEDVIYNSDEIISIIKDHAKKHPEYKLLEICKMKYSEKKSVSEIAISLSFGEDKVIEILNEIIEIVKD